ncbi:hypothetical protein [Guptibacillus hwajinpoensis]|uniref:hypothetical protein n=1 Tax=Guptibacillus hwajinpoensis TaxID=208199 RepID=UPI003734D405
MNIPVKTDFNEYDLNKRICIYQGNGKFLITGDIIHNDNIEIYYNFPNSPSIEFITSEVITSEKFVDYDLYSFSIDLIQTDNNLMGCISGTGHSFNKANNTIDYLDGQIKEISSVTIEDVDRLEFCLLNCSSAGESKNEAIFFQTEDWEISLQPIQNKNENKTKVSQSFSVTHSGSIIRKDRKIFDPDDAEKVIKGLEWLLSLLNEKVVEIPMFFGYLSEEKLFERYLSVNTESNEYKRVWLNIEEHFTDLLPEVVEKLDDEIWGGVFGQLLEWYIELNHGRLIENQIITVQVALELISWNYLVIEKEKIDKSSFKSTWKSDVFRMLFEEFKISNHFNDFNLHSELNNYNGDGAYILTDVRNNIIHPDKKQVFSKDAYYTVLSFGISCLQSALLYLLNYKGKYKSKYSYIFRNVSQN